MNMRKMIVATALALTLAPAGFAARCDDNNQEAHRKYTEIRGRLDAATAAMRTKAEAVKALIPELKAAVDAYNVANKKVMDLAAAEPGKDIDGWILNSRSDANKSAHDRWKADHRDAVVVRRQKLDAFIPVFQRLGKYNVELKSHEVRDRAIDVLRTLEDTAPAAEFEMTVNFILAPPPGVDDFATYSVPVVGPNRSGLLGACYQANEEVKRIRREENDYANKCPVGAAIYEVNVLQGRNGDGSDIVAGRNDGNQGTTRNTTTTGRRHRGGVLTGETRNATGTTTNTTSTANVTGTTSNVTGTTANTTRTAAEVYTVKAGDNLTKIARELAPKLGNPPISELVGRLYANMTTRSRSNPNLIFAGDTINIAAVRAELQG